MALVFTPTTMTVTEKIARRNFRCLEEMKSAAKETFKLLWESPDHTAQDVCDLLGVDAGMGFEVHSDLQTLIFKLVPSYVPLEPPNAYVINLDGTVTIGALNE